jgi:hypothetical protein
LHDHGVFIFLGRLGVFFAWLAGRAGLQECSRSVE